MQLGGQNQLFNILVAGRKLQEGMGQKPQIAIIMGESLPGTDGEIKMSKSLGNHIPLLSEPWDMFGKVMSVPDKAMPIYHKLILGWSPTQVKELQDGLASGALHPNEVKMRLAREIVTIFHSHEAAEESQRRWDEVFRGGSGVPEDIPEASLAAEERVIDILRRLEMVESGAEARRLIEQNGGKLDGAPVNDIPPPGCACRLTVGKRGFVRRIWAIIALFVRIEGPSGSRRTRANSFLLSGVKLH